MSQKPKKASAGEVGKVLLKAGKVKADFLWLERLAFGWFGLYSTSEASDQVGIVGA